MDALLAEKYKNTIGVSFTDRLTDLYNNGFFQISLDFELNRFERYGNKFSMGVRLILRLHFGKMLPKKIRPEFIPTIAQYDRSEGEHSLPTLNTPTHA
jgi:hypothetical protein